MARGWHTDFATTNVTNKTNMSLTTSSFGTIERIKQIFTPSAAVEKQENTRKYKKKGLTAILTILSFSQSAEGVKNPPHPFNHREAVCFPRTSSFGTIERIGRIRPIRNIRCSRKSRFLHVRCAQHFRPVQQPTPRPATSCPPARATFPPLRGPTRSATAVPRHVPAPPKITPRSARNVATDAPL